MAYLSKDDLNTHLYPEITDEIIRKYILPFANLAAFPAAGVTGYTYKAEDTELLYRWDGAQYVPASDPDLIVVKGINSAIAEAKSYLNRYDLLKLFGDDETDPVVESEHLKNLVKDIACWHLIRLANPNVNLELFRTNYQDAIKFLEKVMKGQADPDGWPYKEDDPETANDESSGVQWESNPKRVQHF